MFTAILLGVSPRHKKDGEERGMKSPLIGWRNMSAVQLAATLDDPDFCSLEYIEAAYRGEIADPEELWEALVVNGVPEDEVAELRTAYRAWLRARLLGQP
jgi:hypothetical protein